MILREKSENNYTIINLFISLEFVRFKKYLFFSVCIRYELFKISQAVNLNYVLALHNKKAGRKLFPLYIKK